MAAAPTLEVQGFHAAVLLLGEHTSDPALLHEYPPHLESDQEPACSPGMGSNPCAYLGEGFLEAPRAVQPESLAGVSGTFNVRLKTDM